MTPFTDLPAKSIDVGPPIEDALGSALAHSILDSSPDCIKLIALDGSLIYMNRNGMCAMEIGDFCGIEGKPWPSLWPEDAQNLLQSALEDAAIGETSDFEAFCPTALGTPRWWSVNVTPVRDPSGTVLRILATSRDVTERIQSENILRERDLQLQAYAEKLTAELHEKESLLSRQSVLAAEIDHRVKNSFALIGSILRMKMRKMGDGDARDALADAANRIATLSRVHEQLHSDVEAQDVALGPYLGQLTADLSKSLFDASTVTLGETVDVSVDSDTAVAIGLVTSELVSNALKHKDESRAIDVTVSLTEDPHDGAMILRVADNGLGLPKGFDIERCEGLGMQICQTYSRTLNGAMLAENGASGGAMIEMKFSLAGRVSLGS